MPRRRARMRAAAPRARSRSKMEALRDQWLRAPDLATQKALARDIQLQAFQDVPCMPLGLYYQPVAYRNDLVDMMKGLILFTGVRPADRAFRVMLAKGVTALLYGVVVASSFRVIGPFGITTVDAIADRSAAS